MRPPDTSESITPSTYREDTSLMLSECIGIIPMTMDRGLEQRRKSLPILSSIAGKDNCRKGALRQNGIISGPLHEPAWKRWRLQQHTEFTKYSQVFLAAEPIELSHFMIAPAWRTRSIWHGWPRILLQLDLRMGLLVIQSRKDLQILDCCCCC